MARCSQSAAMADGGKRVLKRAPRGHVHVDIAGSYQRQTLCDAECSQTFKASRIVRTQSAARLQSSTSGEQLTHPRSGAGTRICWRHPQRQAMIQSRSGNRRASAGIRPCQPRGVRE